MSDPTDAPAPDVLATLTPSPLRRLAGTGVLVLLGALLFGLVATGPGILALRLLWLVPAMLAVALAVRLWRATAVRVELTATELRDSAGTRLAPVADIVGVERGMLAFKPSNGFVVRLARKQPRGWAPGLWWRMGRTLGVGGVTPAGEAKAMAEALSTLLARRNG